MTLRRSVVLTAIMVALVMLPGSPASAAPGGADRAMWVWDGPVDGVIDFSVGRAVTDLYLHAPPGFSGDAGYGAFLTAARANGLRVHAMAGDPAWATQPGPWWAWVDEVVGFGGFDGMVFDVEPYLLPDWNTRKQSRLIRSYLSGLAGAVDRAGTLPVLAAVPFWWDDPTYRQKRQPLVQHVLAAADGIVVLAYRDHAEGSDGIIEHAATEASLAATMGKRFVVGVETGPAELDKVSFAEEGESFMNEQLQLVEAAFASSSGFGGIAVHHYGSYSTMLP